MNPLTADEMACVAREVTGECVTVEGDDVFLCFSDEDPYVDDRLVEWGPLFEDSDDKEARSQALAVVEWLADHADEFYQKLSMCDPELEIMKLVKKRDITDLQRMVLLLRNPQ